MANQQTPIYVIKKNASHGGHHGGAWKVAYADFVTAMMALFIVLWLLNSSKQIQEAVGGYFKDPSGTSKLVGSGETGSGDSFTVTKDNMDQLKDELEKAVKEAVNFESLKNNIDMTVTNDGLRIELMESEAGTFFQSGVAEPTANGKEILAKLAQELGKLPNRVFVEGHTDSKPFAGQGLYDNWELSADRANMARRFMQQSGLRSDQVTQVRGYADQRLRKPEAPLDPSNRRVSVIVQYNKKPAAEGEGGESKSEGKEAEAKGGEAQKAGAQKQEAKPEQEKPAAPPETKPAPAAPKQEPKKSGH